MSHEIWVTTTEAAKLLKLKPRIIREHCKNNKYKTRKIKSPRGKDGWEIALSSLPKRPVEILQTADELKNLPGLTEIQIKEAGRRLEIMKKWFAFALENKTIPGACVTEFLEAGVYGVCRATLFNWKRAYDSKGLAGLAPDKKEKTGIKEETFDPQAIKFFNDFYLTQNQVSVREGWLKLKIEAAKRGWVNIGSYTTLKRYALTIPPDVRELKRNGPKKYEDRVVPYIPRDPESITPMEVIECDHHHLNNACNYNGRVIFPWLTLWIDARTWKPLGWALSVRPNSDTIAVSYYKATRDHGLSKKIHVDNGKDFLAKFFNGSKKKKAVNEQEKNLLIQRGVWDHLGVEVGHAKPYNAKGKIIEKFFDLMQPEFNKWLRGYRGKNVQARPEQLKEQIKNRNVLTFDELRNALTEYLEKVFPNRRMNGEYHKGKTPDELFYGDQHIKQLVREDELVLILTTKPYHQKVKQNGLWVKELHGWYFSEKLHRDYYGKYVRYRVVPDEIKRIYVSTLEDVHIDVCDRMTTMAWNEKDKKKYDHHYRIKRIIRDNTVEKYKKLVPKPMSDKERESLIFDPALADYKPPELPHVYVETKFRAMIDQANSDEALKRADKAELKRREKSVDAMLMKLALEAEEEAKKKRADEEKYAKMAQKYMDRYLNN